jgi:hypothetical protein
MIRRDFHPAPKQRFARQQTRVACVSLMAKR